MSPVVALLGVEVLAAVVVGDELVAVVLGTVLGSAAVLVGGLWR